MGAYMADFIKAEELIRQYLQVGSKFRMDDVDYVVKLAGKPQSQRGKGQPKTDIYVLAESSLGEKEIKISYKKENADFLENKMGSDRAEQIFGDNWQSIIEENTRRISGAFENTLLIYLDQRGRTEAGSMKLGWKFELFNKLQGELSGKMENMTLDQVYEVYAGEKLEDRKRDAKVNGEIIPNSGTAEYILVADRVESAQDVIDRMQPIREYIKQHPDIYFGCKALNYRSQKRKIEGNRPLSVAVEWKVESGMLDVDIEYSKPLTRSGKEMKLMVKECLKSLNKCNALKLSDDELKNIPTYKKEDDSMK